MSEIINARFVWTLAEAITMYRIHRRLALRRLPRLYHVMFGFFFIISVGQVLWLDMDETRLISYTFAFIGALWFVCVFWLWPRSMRRVLTKSYNALPPIQRDAEVIWQFDSEKMKFHAPLVNAEFSWDFHSEIVKLPDGLLFYSPGHGVFRWIPKHAFASEADFAQVVSWANDKSVKFTTAT